VAGINPTRRRRFDPPSLVLLALSAVVGFPGGRLLSGEAIGGPSVALAVESSTRKRPDARFAVEGRDPVCGTAQVALDVCQLLGDGCESTGRVAGKSRPPGRGQLGVEAAVELASVPDLRSVG
jgi:hypothetical protein